LATYEAQRNLVEAPSTFELTPSSVIRAAKGATKQEIALGDVKRVRITYQAGPSPCWICAIEAAHGRMWIPSASYRGLGRTQNQGAAFRAFVQTLTSAIAASPRDQPASFLRGGGWMRPFYLGALIALGVLAVLLALGVMGTLMDGKSAVWTATPTLVILFAAQMSWRMWRSNPPATFDPTALPADIAPGG
jgi:hypothetical protein